MRTASVLLLAAVATFGSGQALALYKCTTAKGVVYQDRPCREGAEEDLQLYNSTMVEPDQKYGQDPLVANRTDARRDGRTLLAKAGTKADTTKYAGTDTRRRDAGALDPTGASERRSAQDSTAAGRSDAARRDGQPTLANAGTKAEMASYPVTDARATESGAQGDGGAASSEPAKKPDNTRYYYAVGWDGASPPANITCQTPSGANWQFFLQAGK